MIKFALNIKLRYMLRKVLSLLFFIGFLVNGNLIAQLNLSTNGSFDGNVISGGVPDGWAIFSAEVFGGLSPDVNNLEN